MSSVSVATPPRTVIDAIDARRPGAWLLVVPGVVALAARLVTTPHPIDDAYITFRYARNLAEGLGLVYNPGEWVLGTTAPLWAVVLAVGYRLGAVDVAWFWRSYQALGKERWDEVYAAAKYASGGTGHARARLFADAMTGAGREIWKAEEGRGSVFHGMNSDDQILWAAGGHLVFAWERTGWLHLYSIPVEGGRA